MKYLVMECFNSYAVLLDEEGRFVKSANLSYEVGDTVENPVLMLEPPLEKGIGTKRTTNRVVATVLAFAAIFALFFGVNYYQQNFLPYSSIFMAINPEVEMILNKNGDVLEVNGTNTDGITLIENYEPSSKNRVEVANELMDRAIEMGFLSEGGSVSIAIDTPDKDLFEKYGIELRSELDGRISITIEITDMENRNRTPNVPKNNQPVETPVQDDDSDYDEPDDSGYDDSSYDAPAQAPAPTVTPTPQPPVTDDTDYDDTDYDDTDYDDTSYDDSDYDDTDYDD